MVSAVAPEPSPGTEPTDPYGNGTLVPSDHWGKGCPENCEVHPDPTPSPTPEEEPLGAPWRRLTEDDG
jgi:hypothetical protein